VTSWAQTAIDRRRFVLMLTENERKVTLRSRGLMSANTGIRAPGGGLGYARRSTTECLAPQPWHTFRPKPLESAAIVSPSFAEAGADRIIVRAEATRYLDGTLGAIGALGTEAGVALNPATPESAAKYALDRIDLNWSWR
jgi:hypothetical protein